MLKIDTRFGKVTGFSHIGCFLSIPVQTAGQAESGADQTARDHRSRHYEGEILINDHSCQFPTKTWPEQRKHSSADPELLDAAHLIHLDHAGAVASRNMEPRQLLHLETFHTLQTYYSTD